MNDMNINEIQTEEFKKLVIEAIKFLIEHRNYNHDEMKNGLRAIGWHYWRSEDIAKFNLPAPTKDNVYDALREGNYASAAHVLFNAMHEAIDYAYLREFMLYDNHNLNSLFEFIKVVTGDETYTIENVLNTPRKNK